MGSRLRLFLTLALLTACFSSPASAQEEDPWDNQLYFGGRVATSVGDFRVVQDLQVRLRDDTRALNLYLYEAALSWLPNRHWELVPDLRFSVYPERYEIRPGLGALYKLLWQKKHAHQLVHQFKYQTDFEIDNSPTNDIKHGLRYAAFYNFLMTKRIMLNFGTGIFARFSPDFTGIQFIRTLAGTTFALADTHSIGLSYFVGAENVGSRWTWTGGPLIVFTIRVSDEFVHIPGKIFSF